MYLGIVETESGSPRLSRDLIRVCNLCMRLLDSSVGAFATTSLRALFAVLRVQLLLLLHVHLPLLAFSIGECVSVLRSCTSGTVIVRSRNCCDSGLSSPPLKIVAPSRINLVRLVRYRHCSCNSGSDSGLELGHVGA